MVAKAIVFLTTAIWALASFGRGGAASLSGGAVTAQPSVMTTVAPDVDNKTCAGEFTQDGAGKWCCGGCRPGQRSYEDCDSQKAKPGLEYCRKCEEGTYSSDGQSNNCPPCTTCGSGSADDVQITVSTCQSWKDAVCGCKDTYRCVDDQCSGCEEVTCGDGQAPDGGNGCVDCSDGTYKSGTNKDPCKPWTQCGKGQMKSKNGTSSSNAECTDIPTTVAPTTVAPTTDFPARSTTPATCSDPCMEELIKLMTKLVTMTEGGLANGVANGTTATPMISTTVSAAGGGTGGEVEDQANES